MNRFVRNDDGQIVALEDDAGRIVKEVVRDWRGTLVGVNDLRPPLPEVVAEAVSQAEARIRREMTESVVNKLSAGMAAAREPPPPARPPASAARYHVLLSTAKRGMWLDGGPRHAAVMSALAAMEFGDVHRACRILEGG